MSRENIELVRRLYGELASEGSTREFDQRLTDEALSHYLDPGIECYKVEPLSFYDTGDQVAVVVHIVGRTHELEVDETRSSLLTLRDGLVVRVQSFADPEGAREAAGLPP